jgi:hypothetical protein
MTTKPLRISHYQRPAGHSRPSGRTLVAGDWTEKCPLLDQSKSENSEDLLLPSLPETSELSPISPDTSPTSGRGEIRESLARLSP